MIGDIIIAEPKSLVGFAGARVIEQTIKQPLPDDFQRADFLLEHGLLDIVVGRRNLRETLAKLFEILL
jgi:acetyl-CoA carboxylase carboxyl transferase subunit beta